MTRIRILIADDHLFYREGVRTLLKGVSDIEIVGDAISGNDAVEQSAQLQPDVILMDIKMPGLNGIEATRQILQTQPSIGILIVTMFDDDDTVFAAMRAGARGYLLKDADRDELVRAVAAIHRGEAIFSPAIARRMMSYFARPANAEARSAQAFPELSDREREVLELMAKGHSNPAIASQLVVSIKTVQNHVSSIFNKLQVADRAQAIIRARNAGLGSP